MTGNSAESAGGHVLVVEDHEPTAQIVATVLEGADASISAHVVGDGRKALTVLRDEADAIPCPDLVLLDLDLPAVGGLTVLEKRAEDPALRDIPTVVLSGTGDRDTIERCYERGADRFIEKPDDLEGYRSIADEAIASWSQSEDGGNDSRNGRGSAS